MEHYKSPRTKLGEQECKNIWAPSPNDEEADKIDEQRIISLSLRPNFDMQLGDNMTVTQSHTLAALSVTAQMGRRHTPYCRYCQLRPHYCQHHHRLRRQAAANRRMRPMKMIALVNAAVLFASLSKASAFLPVNLPFGRALAVRDVRPRPLAEIDSENGIKDAQDDRERRMLEEIYLREASMPTMDEILTRPTSRIQFKTITKKKLQPPSDKIMREPANKNRKAKTEMATKPQARTRHEKSTMPGFKAETGGPRASQAGPRLHEHGSERTPIEKSPEGSRQRVAESANKMYQTSANVPKSMLQYVKVIQQPRLLTHQEEISLGESIQAAIRLQRLHDLLEAKLNREPSLNEWCEAAGMRTVEELQQAILVGMQSRNELVVSNLRLVQKVVNIYLLIGLTPQCNAADMIQEGTVALIRAAELYDPERGFRFSTYGMYWIRSAVKNSQVFQSRLVPLPSKLYGICEKLIRKRKIFYLEFGRWPTTKELSKVVGMSEVQVDRCLTAISTRFYSLDAPMPYATKAGDSTRRKIVDEIDSRFAGKDSSAYDRGRLQKDIIDAMELHLASDDVELLLLRYGIKGLARKSGAASLKDLSALYGVSYQVIRRRLRKSLETLQSMDHAEWLPYM